MTQPVTHLATNESEPSERCSPLRRSGARFVAALLVAFSMVVGAAACRGASGAGKRDGSRDKPLLVMLIPSETGSESVLDDYAPLFGAVTRAHGIYFDLRMGDSYNAVVEGMVAGHIDIAFCGTVTFAEIKRRGAGELLAVEEKGGRSVYHAGLFHRVDSGMVGIADVSGKSLALGDPKSTSSFNVPLAMLLDAGIDPPRDLSKILMAGSHSASLGQVEAGHVDVAAASLNAYDKMVAAGSLAPTKVKLLSKSFAIPSPPLAVHTSLSTDVRQRLRRAFHELHKTEGVNAEIMLGYGGKKVDRYNGEFEPAIYDRAMEKLARVTPELVSELIDKASER